MQSWAVSSKFSNRESGEFPSQSGVFGLLGSALGYNRDDSSLCTLLSSLTTAVRIDSTGKVLRDYQSIEVTPGSNKLSNRFYLTNASFMVAVYDPENGSDELLERIEQAVKKPANTLFLGRKSCPPSTKISLGILEKDTLMDALTCFYETPVDASTEKVSVDAWIPGNSGKNATLVNDVPVNFSSQERSHSSRIISNVKIDIINPRFIPPIDPFDILQEED